VRATKREKDAVRSYVEDQAHEAVVHLEKAASEMVGPVRHDIWDVHGPDSRWWVITHPTNLYSQADFKSRSVALTFHVGLALRVRYGQDRAVPLTPEAAELLPGSWRRWQQAFDAYDSGDEAETFQAVGMRLRECLLSFVDETRCDALLPPDVERPKNADFKAWTVLLANHLAPGERSAKLRSYLKSSATEAWAYVNWLTHDKNAVRMDAEIALQIVEHLLGIFTAARLRLARCAVRCATCSSYTVVAGTCTQCDWTDPTYEPPRATKWSDEERARRFAEPCVPSSDISSFTSPEDYLGG
jgi:hypothetical protein